MESIIVNIDLMLLRIDELCAKQGINRTTAFENSGVGKNFKSNLKTSNPSLKKLKALANYLGTTVGYLTGDESEEDLNRNIMKQVIKWLKDNNYFYEEKDDGSVTIGKEGNYIHFTISDFCVQSCKIYENARNGFQLAMKEWERQIFYKNEPHLSDTEKALLKLFRETTEEGRFEIIAATMQIKKSVEKKNTDSDSEAIG